MKLIISYTVAGLIVVFVVVSLFDFSFERFRFSDYTRGVKGKAFEYTIRFEWDKSPVRFEDEWTVEYQQ